MQRLPYTLDEANNICEKLQHLVGQVFDTNEPGIGAIECIAVTPFDHINKKKFLLYYLLAGDAHMALKEDYRGFLFDVCVIARSERDNNDIKHYDIDTWLLKNSLQLDQLLQMPGLSSRLSIDNDDSIMYN